MWINIYFVFCGTTCVSDNLNFFRAFLYRGWYNFFLLSLNAGKLKFDKHVSDILKMSDSDEIPVYKGRKIPISNIPLNMIKSCQS